MIQGGRYQRQAGQHFNPYTYDDIKTIADHLHYLGANPHGGNNRSDSAGGGHAHCGAMIYLGGAWPEEYRDQLFMGNIHGRRINMDILEPKGSGYVGQPRPRLPARQRRVGAVHQPQVRPRRQRLPDRLVRQAGLPPPQPRSLGPHQRPHLQDQLPRHEAGDGDRSAEVHRTRNWSTYQLHDNDWYVRHARRILQERFAANERQDVDAAAMAQYRKVRADAGQMAGDGRRSDEPAPRPVAGPRHRRVERTSDRGRFRTTPTRPCGPGRSSWSSKTAKDWQRIARPSSRNGGEGPVAGRPPCTCASASSVCRPRPRWEIAGRASSRTPEDAADHNLPLTCTGTPPSRWPRRTRPGHARPGQPDRKVPQLLPFMARRIASIGTTDAMEELIGRLSVTSRPTSKQLAILRGHRTKRCRGRRRITMPADWGRGVRQALRASHDAEVRNQSLALAVTFGDAGAIARCSATASPIRRPSRSRRAALASLLGAHDKDLAAVLQKLLGRTGPARRRDPRPGRVRRRRRRRPSFSPSIRPSPTPEKRDAVVNALSARASYAEALLDAVGAKKVPRRTSPPTSSASCRNLGNKALDEKIVARSGASSARRRPTGEG